MANKSRRTGAYTNQKSADQLAGEITALFEPYLVEDISDKAWLAIQNCLYQLILKKMRGEKNSEKA